MKPKWRLSAAIIAIVGVSSTLDAVDINLNVQEVSHIPQGSIGALEDVWGWYDSQNAKYYALTCDVVFIIVDVTDPANPIQLGSSSYGNDPAAVDVKTVGDYAYVASQRTTDLSTIWIYYLPLAVQHPNDPPQSVIVLDDEGTGDVPIDNCHTLFATDDYLFLLESHYFTEGDPYEVAVLSLADPANPVLLSDGIWDVSDFDPAFTWPHAAYAEGTTAYIFNFRGGVYQVDFDGQTGQIISWKKIWYDTERGDMQNNEPHGYYACEPTQPKLPWTHSGWLTQDGQYILVADEHPGLIGNCQEEMTPCLRIFHVDDFYVPQDPDIEVVPLANAFDILWDSQTGADAYFIGAENIDAQGLTTPCPMGDCLFPAGIPNFFTMGIHNPAVKGRLAFIAWYARGFHVLDLRSIADMKHAGYFDHGTGADGDWLAEAYGVYPFSPDGYIYVSGGQGFYIYRYGITGTVSEDSTLSGDVYIYDTLTVASNARLDFTAGTNVYMFKNALIKVNGRLVANGTSADSVRFIVLGGNPQPGDWQGIYVEQNAACTLSHTSITKAQMGIEMRNNSQVVLSNSSVSDNSLVGVYNYKGLLEIADSDVDDNLLYGIDALYAGNIVDNCRLKGNGKYGIRVSGTTVSSDSTTVYACKITDPPAGSAYGISISNNDYVRIEATEIRKYDQGGIYLFKSDPVIKKSSVKVNGLYGIYAFDTSDPYIRECNIDSLKIGVKAAKSSLPNIGIASMPLADSGLCDFKFCDQYYIYSDWGLNPPTLMAEGNYFGDLGPIISKFYGTIDYTPWISYDPFPKIGADFEGPLSLKLDANFPNPFNPTTRISFTIEKPSGVVVEIHNLLGRKIVTIVDSYLQAGEHLFQWDGKDYLGSPVASGVYFYSIRAENHFESKKMTLIR